MSTPEDVLNFWLDEVDPSAWYISNEALDETIRTRFEETWNKAMKGGLGQWLTYPNGALAYIILMDQFSRNMYRDQGKAFASDRLALAAAKTAISKKWDLRIDAPARMFFYMPLMHSENLCDQDRCVRLIKERVPNSDSNLLHARAHREVIRQFGRFPYRNSALERKSTTPEMSYVQAGGYGVTVRELQGAMA